MTMKLQRFFIKQPMSLDDSFRDCTSSLPSFGKLYLKKLPTMTDFETSGSITQIMKGDDVKATVLIKNLDKAGHSIARIYNCCHVNPRLMKKKVKQLWHQYQLIKHTKLIEYLGVYWDASTSSLTIHQQACKESLSCRISSQGPMQSEQEAKLIANDLLNKLLRLHHYGYVHGNIKPNNVMQRNDCDAWLLADYDSVQKHKSQHAYQGSVGWTAPELDVNSNKLVYRASSDIFSFGLIVLFILFGTQPLEVPAFATKKCDVTPSDDEHKVKEMIALRKAIESNWYNKHVVKSEYVMKNYLVGLYYQGKISLALFELLHDGILVYDESKRWSAKQVYMSSWLSDINQ